MTSLLATIDTISSLSNPQQQSLEVGSIYIPKLNDNFESNFSNQVKPSSLLAKRLEVSDLGDLLTKRVKTQSTSISDNGSIEHSPTSKKNLLVDENSPSRAFTRCSSSESSNGLSIQDSFNDSTVVIEIDSRSFPLSPNGNGMQLQHALITLRDKMIEQEAQNLLEILLRAQLCQEPLYIPPLVESTPSLVEPAAPKTKKQAKKKDIKKMEFEQDVTFGSIEYPFLSISTPFPENGDLDSIPQLNFSDFPMIDESSLTCKDPYLDEQVPVSFSTVEKKGKKESKKQGPSSIKSPSQESTKSAPEKKSIKEDKKLISKKVAEKVQKKGKENEKKSEKEVESSKNAKEENIYSRPVFHARRFTQRTKNKWQIAQDEKVKDLVLPALNFNGGYELFFDGNKKKPVPMGSEYQVDITVAAIQRNKINRAKPQAKWDPSSHCENELKKFFGKIETMVNGDINEEKVVDVILDNKNDLKRALKHISANKSKCLDNLRC